MNDKEWNEIVSMLQQESIVSVPKNCVESRFCAKESCAKKGAQKTENTVLPLCPSPYCDCPWHIVVL